METFKDLKDFKYHLIFAASLLTISLLYFSQDKSSTTTQTTKSSSLDTFIPAGYSLVPIEISNYETLDSMIGQFAIVDLYTHRNKKYRPGALAAQNLRLIRSPIKPNKFAVLVRHPKVSSLLAASSQFFVTLKKKGLVGTEVVKSQRRTQSRITVEIEK